MTLPKPSASRWPRAFVSNLWRTRSGALSTQVLGDLIVVLPPPDRHFAGSIPHREGHGVGRLVAPRPRAAALPQSWRRRQSRTERRRLPHSLHEPTSSTALIEVDSAEIRRPDHPGPLSSRTSTTSGCALAIGRCSCVSPRSPGDEGRRAGGEYRKSRTASAPRHTRIRPADTDSWSAMHVIGALLSVHFAPTERMHVHAAADPYCDSVYDVTVSLRRTTTSPMSLAGRHRQAPPSMAGSTWATLGRCQSRSPLDPSARAGCAIRVGRQGGRSRRGQGAGRLLPLKTTAHDSVEPVSASEARGCVEDARRAVAVAQRAMSRVCPR